MEKSMICKGCWIQMHIPIVIRGPFSVPFRLFGVKPSRMSPNICNLCETKFSLIRKTKTIVVPATVLFADIRGYTSFSRLLDSTQVAHLLGDFYETCAPVIWERDGVVNKLIGDAVFVIFNFPITRSDHVKQAVLCGTDLQEKCSEMKARFRKQGGKEIPVGIGVGIHTGNISIGDIGHLLKDFTAIGEVVNLAARLQAVAKRGEVLMSETVYRQVEDIFPHAESRVYKLKGISYPVNAYVLHAYT